MVSRVVDTLYKNMHHTLERTQTILITHKEKKQDTPQASSDGLNATADPERRGSFGSLKCEQVHVNTLHKQHTQAHKSTESLPTRPLASRSTCVTPRLSWGS